MGNPILSHLEVIYRVTKKNKIMKNHIQHYTTFSVNEGRRGSSYGISIEHIEGSKFGPAGSEDGYEIENAPNLLAAINQALENYGLRITYAGA